jgi:hypothetical protein
MSAIEAKRSVEDLAQALYEGSDPSGIPWVKRGRVVREPWLHVARKQLAHSDNQSEPSGSVGA